MLLTGIGNWVHVLYKYMYIVYKYACTCSSPLRENVRVLTYCTVVEVHKMFTTKRIEENIIK